VKRSTLNYFRDERARLTERMADVQREAAENNARRVELEREQSLLSDLLAALDAHVPAEGNTELRRIGAGNAA
jgi:hypothetical protein